MKQHGCALSFASEVHDRALAGLHRIHNLAAFHFEVVGVGDDHHGGSGVAFLAQSSKVHVQQQVAGSYALTLCDALGEAAASHLDGVHTYVDEDLGTRVAGDAHGMSRIKDCGDHTAAGSHHCRAIDLARLDSHRGSQDLGGKGGVGNLLGSDG